MTQEKILLSAEIKRLSNLLDAYYNTELNFRNHCYLRIAYDAVVHDKWDSKIKKPFIKNATENQLQNALALLNKYLSDKQMLLADNEKSLFLRQQYKNQTRDFAGKLF